MNTPTIPKEAKMATGIKGLIGRKMTKPMKFMGEDVTVSKLTVAEVMSIQERAKANSDDDKDGFAILKTVIRAAVEGADELSDADFDNFPLDELATLSNSIMKFSGIGQDAGK